MSEPGNGRAGADVARAYDAWAASYDEMANATRDLDARVVRRHERLAAGRDVVEIGAGTGKNTEWLAQHARSVTAMDFSEGMLARARQRVTSPAVRWARHDVRERWPVADESADLVIANLVLEHVETLAPVFVEAARVLRPGGSLLVCELHPFRQLRGGQAQFVDERGETVRVAAHLHDVSDYLRALVDAGLTFRALGEWRDDERDRASIPRLLSVLGEKPA